MESVVYPHTASTGFEPDRLDATGMIVSLMRDNARLDAALEQSRRELAAARAGIQLAGDMVRRKLSQDLHDGAQQGLIAIQIMAELARERADDQQLAEAIELIGTAAAQTADDLRELSHGNHPVLLANRGLGEALCAVARTSPTAIRVDDGGVGRCSERIEAAIYFCSLEAIQNAIKHAGADAHVTVTIGRDRCGVVFEVADDGIGMQLPTCGGGMGLRSMRDRIEAVGGWFEILSSPGVGTRVRGRVPDAP